RVQEAVQGVPRSRQWILLEEVPAAIDAGAYAALGQRDEKRRQRLSRPVQVAPLAGQLMGPGQNADALALGQGRDPGALQDAVGEREVAVVAPDAILGGHEPLRHAQE